MSINSVFRGAVFGAFAVILSCSFAVAGEALDAGAYSVVLAKDGHAVVRVSPDTVVFSDAFPQIRDSKSPEPVPLDLRRGRIEQSSVIGGLGKGVSAVLQAKGRTWQVTAYPGKPFFTVQMSYENTGKETEKIRALVPWASEGLTLGAGTNRAPILDNGSLTNPQTMLWTSEEEKILSLWNLAIHNPGNGRSLIAGFLTNDRAYTQITVLRNPDRGADAFALFQAECRYDPPVLLAPGERLVSEKLYLSVAEESPLAGLERFAENVAFFNGLEPTRRALPHGWDSWVSHYHKDITEAAMRAELDFEDKHLKRYGWTHFSIDDGWQEAAGDWRADPERFPSGMKAFADDVHGRGMTAAIWTEPFTVNMDSALAKEHPDWLAKPGFMGKTMMGDDELILDITVPEAYTHLRDVYAEVIGEWGYDGLVETDFVYHLLAARAYADPKVTCAEALRRGMDAIREGAGEGCFIMGVSPFPLVGYVADGMRTGIDCAPIWRTTQDVWSWGCVDTLTNAARRYYLAPQVLALDQDCAFFGHAETRKRWKVEDFPKLTWEQQVAWMTGAALTGGAVKVGDAFTLLTPKEVDVLRRLLPVQPKPARPVDLFEREEARIWVLPIDCAIGRWHIVGVFNWNEAAEESIPLDFGRMGLDPDTEYAVFDFWPGAYCGLAKGKMDLTVPAGSVRLLSFRPCQDRPMFLATDSHITQGATDFTALEWRSDTRTLAGQFNGVEDTDYRLWVRTPKGYEPSETSVSMGDARLTRSDEVARIAFHSTATGPVEWQLRF